jgi:acyl-CoA dehydrogenase family protein 9
MAELGFVRSMFLGRLESEIILPFPKPDPDTDATTDEVCTMVREWTESTIDPAAIDREKTIPIEVITGLAELGLFGLTIPEPYGGANLGQTTYARMMEVVANRCASTVTVLGAHLGIGMKGLLLFGTDKQKKRWLPDLATGKRIAAFALTEACAGSDAGALRTTADPLPDGSWKLNGRKIWITNGGIANFFTVFARTPLPDAPDAPLMERPITAFVVPGELDGLSIGVHEDKMGLCGSSTTEIGLEDVVVPADHVIGELGQGFKVALEILNSGRHGLAATCIGQAKLARDLAVEHAREREQFGRPIARFGMVQELLAGMEADIYTMESVTYLTAGLMDAGKHDTMLEAACCKMYATERLWDIANNALQVTGGTGFMREYPYERIIRDARINMIFEGTNQVLRMMIGSQGTRALLKAGLENPKPKPLFKGVHPAFDHERKECQAVVTVFGEAVRKIVIEYGEETRSAQHHLRRLTEMAVAIFGMCAVLSRISSHDGEPSSEEIEIARLASRRCERQVWQTLSESDYPDDAIVERVSNTMTGL